MTALIVLLPVPRMAVYSDISLPKLGLRLRAPTKPSNNNLPEKIESGDDEIDELSFVDGAITRNLSEAITMLSGVDESDFYRYTTMQFTMKSDLFRLSESKRADDESLLREIAENADRLLDGIRIEYCRLDVPQMCFGVPGYIPEKNKDAAFVYDQESKAGRIVAREPLVPIAMPGIGLGLDSISPSFVDSLIIDTFSRNALGLRLRRLLRTFANALSATSDESKILTIIFALDGILTNESSTSKQFKKFIGVSASSNLDKCQGQYEQFCDFYSNVRNPLVHHGKSYSDLGRNRKTDLLYLQSLVTGLLVSMVPDANEEFDDHWRRKMIIANSRLSS